MTSKGESQQSNTPISLSSLPRSPAGAFLLAKLDGKPENTGPPGSHSGKGREQMGSGKQETSGAMDKAPL